MIWNAITLMWRCCAHACEAGHYFLHDDRTLSASNKFVSTNIV